VIRYDTYASFEPSFSFIGAETVHSRVLFETAAISKGSGGGASEDPLAILEALLGRASPAAGTEVELSAPSVFP